MISKHQLRSNRLSHTKARRQPWCLSINRYAAMISKHQSRWIWCELTRIKTQHQQWCISINRYASDLNLHAPNSTSTNISRHLPKRSQHKSTRTNHKPTCVRPIPMQKKKSRVEHNNDKVRTQHTTETTTGNTY